MCSASHRLGVWGCAHALHQGVCWGSSPSPPGWAAGCSPLLQQVEWQPISTRLWSCIAWCIWSRGMFYPTSQRFLKLVLFGTKEALNPGFYWNMSYNIITETAVTLRNISHSNLFFLLMCLLLTFLLLTFLLTFFCYWYSCCWHSCYWISCCWHSCHSHCCCRHSCCWHSCNSNLCY